MANSNISVSPTSQAWWDAYINSTTASSPRIYRPIPEVVVGGYEKWLLEGVITYGLGNVAKATDDWIGEHEMETEIALRLGHLHRFDSMTAGLTDEAVSYLTYIDSKSKI